MAVDLTFGVNPGTLSSTANVATLFNLPANARAVTVTSTVALKFFFGVTGVADAADVSASTAYLEVPANGTLTVDVTREEFGHPAKFALASATTSAAYKVAPHAKGM